MAQFIRGFNWFQTSTIRQEERAMAMNLVELQAYLGKAVKDINDPSKDEFQIDMAMRKATATVSVAKQMINNADVILRSDKLYNEGGLSNSSIMGLVWSEDEISKNYGG